MVAKDGINKLFKISYTISENNSGFSICNNGNKQHLNIPFSHAWITLFDCDILFKPFGIRFKYFCFERIW